MQTRWHQPHCQRGMSLVELMVGITIGLFIVAAAVTLVAAQLADNRKLSVELQVQQDLRATADIITRQLRRAGFAGVGGAQSGVTSPGDPAPPSFNGMAALTTPAADFNSIEYAYYYNAGDTGPYGYRLANGVIEAQIGPRWQQLTDPRTLRITTFTVTPTSRLASRLPCPVPCADGTSNCWPELLVRELAIVIQGVAVSDPAVVREITSQVRLRNDFVRFNIPGPNPGDPPRACPPG